MPRWNNWGTTQEFLQYPTILPRWKNHLCTLWEGADLGWNQLGSSNLQHQWCRHDRIGDSDRPNGRHCNRQYPSLCPIQKNRGTGGANFLDASKQAKIPERPLVCIVRLVINILPYSSRAVQVLSTSRPKNYHTIQRLRGGKHTWKQTLRPLKTFVPVCQENWWTWQVRTARP